MRGSETCAFLERVFRDHLGGQPLLTRNFVKWLNFPLVRNERWHGERIVLIGDALHTAHFSIGSGTKLAVEDAIALARALYGTPAVLVLDEPNAFLDNAGEMALIGALQRARARGATVIVIAHRRSVVEAADELLVLEEGRPKMMGPSAAIVRRLAAPQKSKAENAA